MQKFFLWLLALLAGATHATTSEKDYVGMVAAEVAYAALIPDAAPVKPKVPQSQCKTCQGSGRVRTGDLQGWTKCPDCEPDKDTGPRPVLKSTAPGQGWPARTVPHVGG